MLTPLRFGPDVDAFGRPLHEPRTRSQRVNAVRSLAASLQGSEQPYERWLGNVLSDWLRDGGSLEAALGIKPAPGSRATVQRQIQQEKRDASLVRFAVAVGSDRIALAILRGDAPCPAPLQDACEELRAQRVALNSKAISCARKRVKRHWG